MSVAARCRAGLFVAAAVAAASSVGLGCSADSRGLAHPGTTRDGGGGAGGTGAVDAGRDTGAQVDRGPGDTAAPPGDVAAGIDLGVPPTADAATRDRPAMPDTPRPMDRAADLEPPPGDTAPPPPDLAPPDLPGPDRTP